MKNQKYPSGERYFKHRRLYIDYPKHILRRTSISVWSSTKRSPIKFKMLEKLWDDVVAGPQPESGLGALRKLTTNIKDEGEGSKYQRTASMPATPTTPMTPTTPTTPGSARKVDNVWRSVFNPGSNSATKTMGTQMFDKPLPNTPTVYDWLYSGESRTKHHR